ncbi:MAG TPA: histidine triad nucleotide-binding protein [Dehalococcoidia bacterium]|nr:histidine triad nucleotide-binding protein [Dehalococcoidia bacterium]
MDCIFCKIVAGDIPSDILYRDDKVVAFRDINPLSPVHVLIIPGEHIAGLSDLTEEKSILVSQMVNVANRLARSEGIAESGYRVVINCGEQGGQLVPHLHMHLMGGRKLSDRLG